MGARLYRSRDDRILAGVAGGVAEYFDLDPSLVRIAWAAARLRRTASASCSYIVMAIVVPEEPGPASRPMDGDARSRSGHPRDRCPRRTGRRSRTCRRCRGDGRAAGPARPARRRA